MGPRFGVGGQQRQPGVGGLLEGRHVHEVLALAALLEVAAEWLLLVRVLEGAERVRVEIVLRRLLGRIGQVGQRKAVGLRSGGGCEGQEQHRSREKTEPHLTKDRTGPGTVNPAGQPQCPRQPNLAKASR